MRTLKRRLMCVAAAAVIGWVAQPTGAKASLIGDTITIISTANFPVDTWSDTVVVGAGIELDGNVAGSEHVTPTMGQGFAALFPGDFIDVGANSITISFAALGGPPFNYAFSTDFLDLDWTGTPGVLTNVTVAPDAVGLVAFNLNPGNITANSFQFQGTVDLQGGANFTLDLTTIHDPVAAIPVPAALPLFGTGLAVMGFLGWRRRRKAAAV